MEEFFRLKDHDTDVKTEIVAGITSFMTMAYILAVNPIILSDAGMDRGGVFTATALASVIATLMMAIHAKYPFVLAPGMGLNAFFAYTVVADMGYSWQFALTAVLIEGIIFILLSFVRAREAIFNAIPLNLKKAVSVGIGLFIAFIGLSDSGIVVVGDGVPLALGNMKDPAVALALIGVIIIGFLLAKKVKGALLIGIIITTLVGIPLGVTVVPEGSIITLPPSLSEVAFQFEWENILTMDMAIAVLTFLFVDIFDTIGTLTGVASKANMLDEEGEFPGANKAFLADAVGTVAGACLGTSTVTTYVESASGVAEGGRTGLTALSAAGMFALSLFFAPLFTMVPSSATAPALILVGLFMMSPIKEIDLEDYTEAIPAFLTIIMMPLAYSIAEGIVFGMLSYVILKLITGRREEISIAMYILSILFIIRFMI